MEKAKAKAPTNLMCELLNVPCNSPINNPIPRFSWTLDDDRHGIYQIASRIMVASSPELLLDDIPDMWDTGDKDPAKAWVSDSQSLHIQYAGKPLKENCKYFWKVMIWNSRGERSYWSNIASFFTGSFSSESYQPTRQVEFESEQPKLFTGKTKNCVFIDFGRVAFGTLEFTLNVSEKKTVEVALGEISSNESLSINENPGGSRRFKKIRFALVPGVKKHRLVIPPDPRNTKTVLDDGSDGAILVPPNIGEVMPFRYCEISGDLKELTPESVKRLFAHYPFDDKASAFHCSCQVLNDVWELCRYSIKATSFLGIYIDGDRERIPYEADAYINQLSHYYCDREFAMARRTHEYLLTHPNWPTEWIFFSVMMAWADYEHTGDASFLKKYYNDLVAKALIPLRNEDALIDTSPERQSPELLRSIHMKGNIYLKNIVDWPECERDGYEMLPVNTVVNAFHFHVLKLLAKIADILGQQNDSKDFVAKAEQTRRAMLEKLVNPKTGLFVDGEGSKHSSIHANLFPLAFGVVRSEMISNIAAFLKRKGMACSVYAAQFLLEALYKAGEYDAALALMTSTGERSWARWIYELGATITLEAWDDRFKPNQDWNHAWGSAPANIIPRYLMGVRPLKPGFEKILIQPSPGSLEYANITLPTIRGSTTVAFNNRRDSTFILDVRIPANSSAKIVLPPSAVNVPHVLLNGRQVIAMMENGRAVLNDIPSGRHTIQC